MIGRSRCVVVLALALLATAGRAVAQRIMVSAAISTKDAGSELGRVFASSHPGATLLYNWGSSGSLQKQIEAGAPIDVFISAAARQMDALEERQADRSRHAKGHRAQPGSP